MDRNRAAGPRQGRDLLTVAFGPSLVALLVIAAVVLIQLVVANSDLTGAMGAIASLWLGVHQVPVTIAGHELSVMPLLPVLAMVWGTARTTARATPADSSWFVIRWIVAASLGGPLLMTAIALAVIHDAGSVLTELQTPNALRAFGGVLAVHAIGAALGVVSRTRDRVMHDAKVPVWVGDSVRAAAAGVCALLGLSGVITTVSLVVHWAAMHDAYAVTDSLFGQLSLTLLAILYIPNVIVGAAAVAVGSSVHVGIATFSAFTVYGGDIPAVPVLAAAPPPPLGPIWVILLIAAAASAVALGQQCARRPLPVTTALAKLVLAALISALVLAVLGYAAGGRLGNFGEVGVDQSTFGPAVFVWFAGIGALTVAMSGGIVRPPRRRRVPDAEEDRDVAETTDKAPAAEEGTPVATDEAPAAEESTPVATDEAPVADESAPVGDDGTRVADDSTPESSD
ncbi:MAG: hypothetical protein QOH60_426 [Mycobacterium sp.]|jgi:hypothetical protein|nr:hypothetical protein [Mycobacterium sp.]